MSEPGEIDRTTSPRGELSLRRRGDGALELRVNGVFVMDTLETTSERLLATSGLARHPHPERVLVGGLGLGFTTRSVLDDPRVLEVDVVEIEAAVIGWLRSGAVPTGPALLADPRLRVVEDDVARVIAAAEPARYDLVLLDVDNGPGFLVHDPNAALYSPAGLLALRRALCPGGRAVIWSADEAPRLAEHLRGVFEHVDVEAVDVPAHGRNEVYWLYAASVPG